MTDAAATCPVLSEPWDNETVFPCERPEGHDGKHAYCIEWGDDGTID